ncbi:hypothetical protein Taro_013088, partial [Colocasia esculenta]|nr:hypothetical protein [Colocasia esculenta]
VENLSSLNVICHFSDGQDIMVAGKQSSSVFLRHISVVDQDPEIKSSVSICASENGDFSTVPLHISLSSAQMLAWRTYVVSRQGYCRLLYFLLAIQHELCSDRCHAIHDSKYGVDPATPASSGIGPDRPIQSVWGRPIRDQSLGF